MKFLGCGPKSWVTLQLFWQPLLHKRRWDQCICVALIFAQTQQTVTRKPKISTAFFPLNNNNNRAKG